MTWFVDRRSSLECRSSGTLLVYSSAIVFRAEDTELKRTVQHNGFFHFNFKVCLKRLTLTWTDSSWLTPSTLIG